MRDNKETAPYDSLDAEIKPSPPSEKEAVSVIPSFKPGEDQNIALYASSTARNLYV